MKKKVLGIFTCFNRKEKTVNCLKSLIAGNEEVEFTFLAVDDGSTDGTEEALRDMRQVAVLTGNGSLFYSGGMRLGIRKAKEQYQGYDYCLLFNDDVEFYPGVIERMAAQCGDGILVGATCDTEGNLSYGGVRKASGFRPKFDIVMSGEKPVSCDTFNANCVLIPYDIFLKLPNIDEAYTHSLGDFDYGLTASQMGYAIYPTNFFVGCCNDNPVGKTWRDTSLSRKERWKRKESPKGLPTGEWFHFVRKNFGLISACYSSMTPMLRILLGK
ncbi:glycosyltransferase family 2 protein [Anaerosacchariphilus sp. NSJ-68]|uniref:Glycosyltransferase family 2 protein n=2 Tax=Lachnospiraceae TaxID=186803 RepID=A0A923RL08_9FIRM|nr:MULTISPECIES: glycosyltransferase family 2 protein [Lachnospiraceae]MBC5658734.1 glycosyltransferase family 2 protein [Anaerosacchariphilus hominis]MBC5698997.1 glycosyltransferase family 2 protein [Roseburia difficilis]